MRCALLERDPELVFLIDSATEDILHDAIFETSPDGVRWVIILSSSELTENDANIIRQVGLSHRPICAMETSKIDDSEVLRRCRVSLTNSGTPSNICRRHFRARLLDDKDVKWTVYEMLVEFGQH